MATASAVEWFSGRAGRTPDVLVVPTLDRSPRCCQWEGRETARCRRGRRPRRAAGHPGRRRARSASRSVAPVVTTSSTTTATRPSGAPAVSERCRLRRRSSTPNPAESRTAHGSAARRATGRPSRPRRPPRQAPHVLAAARARRGPATTAGGPARRAARRPSAGRPRPAAPRAARRGHGGPVPCRRARPGAPLRRRRRPPAPAARRRSTAKAAAVGGHAAHRRCPGTAAADAPAGQDEVDEIGQHGPPSPRGSPPRATAVRAVDGGPIRTVPVDGRPDRLIRGRRASPPRSDRRDPVRTSRDRAVATPCCWPRPTAELPHRHGDAVGRSGQRRRSSVPSTTTRPRCSRRFGVTGGAGCRRSRYSFVGPIHAASRIVTPSGLIAGSESIAPARRCARSRRGRAAARRWARRSPWRSARPRGSPSTRDAATAAAGVTATTEAGAVAGDGHALGMPVHPDPHLREAVDPPGGDGVPAGRTAVR